MNIEEKLQTVAENQQRVYDAGYEKSRAECQAECQAVHFSTSVYGSGIPKLEIPIPFMPDMLSVYCVDAFTENTPLSYLGVQVDFRACGKASGVYRGVASTGQLASVSCSPSLRDKDFNYSNGVLTFVPTSGTSATLNFREQSKYAVVATTYPGEDGKTLLREQIENLPDQVPSGQSNQLTFTRAAVERYMTAEEWENLIATKPNWKFVMQ